MNELQLSNDLPQIEFEISRYQQQGAEAIFEIGKRLKHVKENNLQYGEFGKWLDEIGIDHTFAKRSMKISSELNIDSAHVHQLGIRALTQIVSLPEEHREEKQQTSSGGMKTPYEMTNKEREEFKRQLKQRDEEKSQLESQLEQAQRSESIARKQLEDAEDKEPEIKREVKEIIPPHVKAQLSDRQQMINAKDKEIEQLREQISKAEEQKQKFEKQDYLEDEEQIASMNFQVESTVLEIKDNINRFLNENSANAFKEAAIARASERTKNQIYDGIEELEAFCRTMRRSLDSNVIIGG
ncbi:hypothetical protein [Staphylococcus saprophyticus]|uniref:hypothetical protein n=1 Tax=Staphylococcus saprophyticus TaxID=29385 RepID=UPI0021B51524|nr:hypothetical protein [Staphylococcus saprophyticus]